MIHRVARNSLLAALLFTSSPSMADRLTSDLYVLEKGKAEKQLTNDDLTQTRPSWMGEDLLFAELSPDDITDTRICRLHMLTGIKEVLIEDEYSNYAPDWSGTVGKMLFLSNRDAIDQLRLYTADINGENIEALPVQLPKGTTGVSDARWSPNGKFIAYGVHDFDAANTIQYVYEVSTEDTTRIVSRSLSNMWGMRPIKRVFHESPSWSSDGKNLGFLVHKDGFEGIQGVQYGIYNLEDAAFVVKEVPEQIHGELGEIRATFLDATRVLFTWGSARSIMESGAITWDIESNDTVSSELAVVRDGSQLPLRGVIAQDSGRMAYLRTDNRSLERASGLLWEGQLYRRIAANRRAAGRLFITSSGELYVAPKGSEFRRVMVVLPKGKGFEIFDRGYSRNEKIAEVHADGKVTYLSKIVTAAGEFQMPKEWPYLNAEGLPEMPSQPCPLVESDTKITSECDYCMVATSEWEFVYQSPQVARLAREYFCASMDGDSIKIFRIVGDVRELFAEVAPTREIKWADSAPSVLSNNAKFWIYLDEDNKLDFIQTPGIVGFSNSRNFAHYTD